jgi:uncharacterized SAM-binding protein YcdF (DUF218 family)
MLVKRAESLHKLSSTHVLSATSRNTILKASYSTVFINTVPSIHVVLSTNWVHLMAARFFRLRKMISLPTHTPW